MLKVALTYSDNADHSISLPVYETAQSAGMDIRANFSPDLRKEGVLLLAGQRFLVPTGLCIEIPNGYEAQIRPRSGLALKYGITIANTPGTIDADYRGEIGVILLNTGNQSFTIAHGDRIAQIVFAPVVQAKLVVVDALNETDRGRGGFGSTGRQ